jgi:hypothetical protein
MNDRLLEILTTRQDFNVSDEDKKRLAFFVEYLDHGSLFMVGFEPGDDPAFLFTNDAQRYRFTLSEIRELVDGMKSGVAMKWEEIPYEPIGQGSV